MTDLQTEQQRFAAIAYAAWQGMPVTEAARQLEEASARDGVAMKWHLVGRAVVTELVHRVPGWPHLPQPDEAAEPELLAAAKHLDATLTDLPQRSGFDKHAMRMPMEVSLAIRRVREAVVRLKVLSVLRENPTLRDFLHALASKVTQCRTCGGRCMVGGEAVNGQPSEPCPECMGPAMNALSERGQFEAASASPPTPAQGAGGDAQPVGLRLQQCATMLQAIADQGRAQLGDAYPDVHVVLDTVRGCVYDLGWSTASGQDCSPAKDTAAAEREPIAQRRVPPTAAATVPIELLQRAYHAILWHLGPHSPDWTEKARTDLEPFCDFGGNVNASLYGPGAAPADRLAPQAPQAPALVPLTDADRTKLLQRAGFAGLLMEIRASGALSARGDTDLIDRVDMAIADFESAGITPTTKEQQQ